jgi:shikimate dehydrogenase
VGHSRSPWIHAKFAEQTGEDIAYGSILAPEGGFDAAVATFRAGGGKGANVTLPFKEDAFALADDLSARARAARAVNTLLFSNSGIRGDNTDGCGLTRDLTLNCGFSIQGRRVLLIGAGGAARGVLLPLLEERPAILVIVNRSVDRAHQLAGRLPANRARAVSTCSYAELSNQSFDLVINATSAGLANAALPLPRHLFSPGSLAYEMVYGRETPFMRQARADGAGMVSDGAGMLIEQAAESFFLWRGIRPHAAPVLAELRAA